MQNDETEGRAETYLFFVCRLCGKSDKMRLESISTYTNISKNNDIKICAECLKEMVFGTQ